MAVRRKHIRSLAERLLAECDVASPPVPVESIAKRYGIKVERQSYEDEISGFLYRDRKRAVIGVNGEHADNRQRFTIAHELGHFLLHPEGLEEVHVDRNFGIRLRSELSSQGTDDDEKEANLFAAELLMPAGSLQKDMLAAGERDIDSCLQQLAKKYRVSPQALSFRLAYLGYVIV